MQRTRAGIVSAEIGRPVLQGRQPLAGLWFPADWFNPLERRRRILANWRAGASAFSFPVGDLLRYSACQDQNCAIVAGWPLRLEGRTLCSAAVEPSEARELAVADVWIVTGGQVTALNFADATPLDPSTWIDIGDFSLLETYDCRAALPKATLEIPDEARNLREVLGKAIPPGSAERESFLRAVQSRQASLSQSRKINPSSGLPLGWKAGLLGTAVMALLVSVPPSLPLFVPLFVIATVLAVVLSRSGSDTRAARGVHPSPRHSQVRNEIPARRSRLAPQRWRDWLARIAMMTQLSRLLGRQQAAYLRRMIDLFEAGNLEEALRHAISLSGETGSLGQAFATPTARNDLALNRSPGPSASIHLGQQMDGYLRQLYRSAFEKLDRAGRTTEATFVLAELMQNRQEALDYLEKHGKFAEAAELALAWDRPSDVIVRLHCLAGDWRRAVAVARRDGAFANAVLMLEKKWPDPAKRLRLEWAEALAAQCDWLAAVEAVWPLSEHRDKARAWLASAEAGGGQLAARALVKRAVLLPDTLDAYADTLTALRDDRERHRERGALAEALLALAGKPGQAAHLARILAPATLADQSDGVGRLSKKDMQRLLALANDKLLRADLPNAALPVITGEPLFKKSTVQFFEAPTAGSRPILDAVPLEEGSYLVAFGEAGAAVIGSDGRILFRIAVPTEKLVLAYNRQQALALARRGDVWRVSRLDLSNRRATDLGVLDAGHFVSEFDGIAWTIACDKWVRVVDTARSLQTVLWQVNDLPGPVLAMSANGRVEQWLIAGEGYGMELWRYNLPQRRLIARDSVAMPDSDQAVLLNPGGGVVTAALRNGESDQQALVIGRYSTTTREIALPTADRYILKWAQPSNEWALLGLEGTATNSMIWFVSLADGKCRAQLEWPSLEGVGLRSLAATWLIFDNSGRLFYLDAANGTADHVAVQ